MLTLETVAGTLFQPLERVYSDDWIEADLLRQRRARHTAAIREKQQALRARARENPYKVTAKSETAKKKPAAFERASQKENPSATPQSKSVSRITQVRKKQAPEVGGGKQKIASLHADSGSKSNTSAALVLVVNITTAYAANSGTAAATNASVAGVGMTNAPHISITA